MVPGSVQLGSIAVAGQLLVIAALYAYLRSRHPVMDLEVRRRVVGVIVVGSILIAGGQLLLLGSVGSLRATSWLTFQQALWLQDVGLVVAFVGYLLVTGGLVWHGREATGSGS